MLPLRFGVLRRPHPRHICALSKIPAAAHHRTCLTPNPGAVQFLWPCSWTVPAISSGLAPGLGAPPEQALMTEPLLYALAWQLAWSLLSRGAPATAGAGRKSTGLSEDKGKPTLESLVISSFYGASGSRSR